MSDIIETFLASMAEAAVPNGLGKLSAEQTNALGEKLELDGTAVLHIVEDFAKSDDLHLEWGGVTALTPQGRARAIKACAKLG